MNTLQNIYSKAVELKATAVTLEKGKTRILGKNIPSQVLFNINGVWIEQPISFDNKAFKAVLATIENNSTDSQLDDTETKMFIDKELQIDGNEVKASRFHNQIVIEFVEEFESNDNIVQLKAA